MIWQVGYLSCFDNVLLTRTRGYNVLGEHGDDVDYDDGGDDVDDDDDDVENPRQ